MLILCCNIIIIVITIIILLSIDSNKFREKSNIRVDTSKCSVFASEL